ncbi:unnamed protein product [Camellia sinensis]
MGFAIRVFEIFFFDLRFVQTLQWMLLVLRFSHSVKQRLIGTRAGIFTGVTVALYPVSLIKTRLQVASKNAGERGAFSIIRGILRTDGIPGLYRGFGTVVTGAISTRIIFLTALETTKAATFRLVEPFKLSKPTQAAIANGVAGMAAAVCSQAVFVPIIVREIRRILFMKVPETRKALLLSEIDRVALCSWIRFFWTMWLATKKSVGLAKHSLTVTGSVLSAYSSAQHVRSRHELIFRVLGQNANESMEAFLANKPAGFKLKKNLLPLETIYQDINRILSPVQQDSSSIEPQIQKEDSHAEMPTEIAGPNLLSTLQGDEHKSGPEATTVKSGPETECSNRSTTGPDFEKGKSNSPACEVVPAAADSFPPQTEPICSTNGTGDDVEMKELCDADSSADEPTEESADKSDPGVIRQFASSTATNVELIVFLWITNVPGKDQVQVFACCCYDKPAKGRKINWMKGGILESDRVVTVTPYYAQELVSGIDKGVELDNIIRKTGITGIVNGMDVQEWNPSIDKYIDVKYNATTVMAAKCLLKEALQAEVGLLVDANIPLIGFIGRLEEQKGLDILAAAIPKFIRENVQIVVLGPLELASAGVSISIFNIISKVFNIPLLSVATSFVAEDIPKNASKGSTSEINNSKLLDETDERTALPSVPTALLLALGIGLCEALAMYLGSGLFLNMMGISTGLEDMKTMELETNSIDRAVANLMFSKVDSGGIDLLASVSSKEEAKGTTKQCNYSLNQPQQPHWHHHTRSSTGDAEVPIFVVSQKLMVQGYSGHATYNGGLDVARKVLTVDGIRGLYRGFGLSVLTYSPSSVVWWASYGSSQRLIWSGYYSTIEHEESAPSLWTIVSVQAAGGIFTGATASCITTPLDTIKTRLQVMGHEKKLTVREVVKGLVADDGWKGLYRGLGPRFFTMSAWGTSMILSYEYLKRLCVKDQ